jgi:hypothetical protein
VSHFSNVPETLTDEEHRARFASALKELARPYDTATMLRAFRGPVVPVPVELAERMAEHERQLGGQECHCEMCTHVRAIATPPLPEP